MTKKEIIDNIARLNSQTWRDREEVRTEIGKLLSELTKSLEQEHCEDIMAIHTQGLDEGIRCAMCTNSMKSDRGCDGGCVINEAMYKEVMNTIRNHIVPSVTPIRKKGHWIDHSDEGYVECSECGSCTNCDGNITDLHFCFSCGAEMDEDEYTLKYADEDTMMSAT